MKKSNQSITTKTYKLIINTIKSNYNKRAHSQQHSSIRVSWVIPNNLVVHEEFHQKAQKLINNSNRIMYNQSE